jgi:gliding motility-associated-like protein
MVIRVSAFEEDVAYRISIPAQPAFSTIEGIAAAGSIRTIDLTPQKALVETSIPDAIGNHGILVEVTGTGLPYFEVTHPNNPAILNLKGGLGLGTEFYTPFQNVYDNRGNKDGVSGFIVTATRDATSITITPAIDMVGHTVADGPFTVVLNRGQSWLGLALGKDPADRLVGTHIQSDRAIAVTIYDDNIEPTGSGNYDLGADQLVPVGLGGLEHVVVAAAAGAYEHAFIMASQDNTLLYLDSLPNPIDTLDAGEQHTFNLTGPAHFLRSDKPVQVLQLTGIGGEMGYSMLHPMTCTGLSRVGFYRTSANSWRPIVIADSSAIDHFEVDGNPGQLVASEFTPVPGTNGAYLYSYNDFGVTAGEEHLITNTGGNFHFGVVNNLGASCETGFYSWFGPSKPYLGADRVLCSSDLFPLTLRPNVVADSYLWNDGSTLDSLVINNSGSYYVQASFGTCGTSYDTVTIVLDTLPTVALVGDSVEAICTAGVATFDLTDPSVTAGSDPGTITYHRSELGAQVQSDTIGNPAAVPPGVYWLRLTTECLCYSTRQITVWTDCTPLLNDDMDTTDLDATAVFDVLANDDDPYGNLDTGSVVLLDPAPGGTLTLDSAGWVSYTPNLLYWLLQDTATWQPDSFRYQDCDFTGNCASAWAYIDIVNTWEGPFSLPDSFAVNEDQSSVLDVLGNDLFIVQNLDDFPNASLTVFNRWENVVFEADPYRNTWDGRNQSTGRELPEGTYFFIFRFDATDPASPTVQRAVTLLR